MLLHTDSHPRTWEASQRRSHWEIFCVLELYPQKNFGNHREVPGLFFTYIFMFRPTERHFLSHDADHRPRNKGACSICPTFPSEIPCLVQNHGQCLGRPQSPANPTILAMLILWHIFFNRWDSPTSLYVVWSRICVSLSKSRHGPFSDCGSNPLPTQLLMAQ